MTSRIDLRPFLTDPLHWVRIMVYVLIAMVAFVALHHYVNRRSSQGGWCATLNSVLPITDPVVVAGWIEVEEAMNAFAGYGSRGVWRGTVTLGLSSMVFLYVVGPTLLVWGLHARARYRRHEPVKAPAAAIAVALTVGVCAFLLLLPGFFMAYAAIGEQEEDVARQAVQSEAYELGTEITLMARKAQVAYFVAGEPWELTGSWQLSDGSREPALSIVQLIDPSVEADIKDSRHAVIGGRSYELIIERADSLTLRGACPPVPLNEHGEPICENVFGRTVTIGLTPTRMSLAYNE